MTPLDLYMLGIFQAAEPGAESLACLYAFSDAAPDGMADFMRLGSLAKRQAPGVIL